MAPRLLDAHAMRYLGLLIATLSISSPALARKHQKQPPKHEQPAPPEIEAPPAKVEAPRTTITVAQSDDDEVPGKKHKK